MTIEARPWKPQDLLDDLQSIIDEEPDSYMNTRRTTLCMARDYLKEYFAPLSNDPLTLDQLREMDGEPVWVTKEGYKSRWALVFVFWGVAGIIYIKFNNGSQPLAKTLLNDGCRIYRRKPEEATK